MLEIRRAVAEDADGVGTVVDQMTTYLRQFYRPTGVGYARRARTQGQRTRLVAVDEGTVVGTVEYLPDGEVLRVIGLAVHERHRRRGIARALVERLAAVSADLGCRAMSLSTVTATGNVPIFQALGFDVVRIGPAEFCISQTGECLQEVVLERRTPALPASTATSAAPSDPLSVDLEALASALKHHFPGAVSYLDRQTGEVLLLDDEGDDEMSQLWDRLREAPGRYAEIEPIQWSEAYGIMQDFIRRLPEGKAKKKLHGTTQRHHRSFRRFRAALDGFPLVRQEWTDFYEAAVQDRARQWLESYRANPSDYGPGPSLAEADAVDTDHLSGECCSCGDYGSVTDTMLCLTCAQGLERDLIRVRDWDYSALAYGVRTDDREAFRNRIIKEHGEALEIIVEPTAVREARRRRTRKT